MGRARTRAQRGCTSKAWAGPGKAASVTSWGEDGERGLEPDDSSFRKRPLAALPKRNQTMEEILE